MTSGQIAALAAGGALAFVGLAVFYGRKPGPRPPDESDPLTGLAPGDPLKIAFQNGVPLDVEALARMIRSEHGSDSELVQVATAWVAVNYARRAGVSVAKLLLRPQGLFGAQWAGPKYASTRLPSTPAARRLAADVLEKRRPDPTGGAVQFDSPAAQRAALSKGLPGYKSTPEQIAAKRIAEGKEQVTLPGVPADQIRFWRYA